MLFVLFGVFVLVGFVCDVGVVCNYGCVGVVQGLCEICCVLVNVFVYGLLVFVDVGDVMCEDGDLECVQVVFGGIVCKLFDVGVQLVVFGGGYEVVFGIYQGLCQYWQK